MLDIKSKGPRFDPQPGHGDFLRVRDRCIRTMINHSQDLGMRRLRSIVHKTWAYQDSNKSSQVIDISVLLLIIGKTWAYQLRHDQSFARLGHQDSNQSFTRLWHIKNPIVHKTWAYQDSDQSFARLWHIQTYMPIMSCMCQSCQ